MRPAHLTRVHSEVPLDDQHDGLVVSLENVTP